MEARMRQYLGQGDGVPFRPPGPAETDDAAPLDQLIAEYDMDWEEKVVLLLAIAALARPQAFSIFLAPDQKTNQAPNDFGGIRNREQGTFVPTGETALFIIAAGDMTHRIKAMQLLLPEHFFFRDQILQRPASEEAGLELCAPLKLSMASVYRLFWGKNYGPDFSVSFPATRVTTAFKWEDLILAPSVMEQIMEIKTWMKHHALIRDEWELNRFIKPGYRSLFHGAPGTGKKLAAALLGSSLGRDVYRVDLSIIVSKYISETEKNLANIFDQAQKKGWILFFDESDVLFGNRTQAQSSNDRYANQETSYLLKRIEGFPGLVILASSSKGNIDAAFARRFQSMVYFPMPSAPQRLQLWHQAFSHGLSLADDVDLEEISEKFELTGGEIVNVVRTLALRAAEREASEATSEDILVAIRKEYQRVGRVFG